MATKLTTLLGVLKDVKTKAQRVIDGNYHAMEKKPLFEGMAREYTPRDEEGEDLPKEEALVEYRAEALLAGVVKPWARMLDMSATVDAGNGTTGAWIVVDGVQLTEELPPVHLIFLEKQLVHLRTMIAAAPTLNPAKRWDFDGDQDLQVSGPTMSTKSRKVMRNHVLHEGTDRHPPQVQVYQEDIPVGDWKRFDYSGALPVQRKREMLERVDRLIEATKRALSEANDQQVDDVNYAQALFDYVLAR